MPIMMESLFPLSLFDGGYESEPVEGFTARRVPLAATLYDRLDWKPSFAVARAAIARGELILWDLDLGLFSRLPLPLSDEGQFRACALAVESLLSEIQGHFLDATIGVCLYRGNGDFRRGFPWEPGDEPGGEPGDKPGWETKSAPEYEGLVTCRDRCFDFLRQLVVNWPDSLPLFVMLDMRRLPPLTQLMFLHREQLGPFCPIVRGISPWWQFPHLGWEEWAESGTLSRQLIFPLPHVAKAYCAVRQGLLVPSEVMDLRMYALCESFLKDIECQGAVTRLLTESSLTAEWDGLDRIFVFGEAGSVGAVGVVGAGSLGSIGSTAKRALQGFEAAGGEIHALSIASLEGND